MVILEKKKIRNAVMQEMQSLQVKKNYQTVVVMTKESKELQF